MWIQDYREAHGLDLYELRQLVNEQLHRRFPYANCWISEYLLGILENSNSPRTHPTIATVIADVCRATPKQFNQIVHSKHWGIYQPQYPPDPDDTATDAPKSIINPRAVVKLNDLGEVVGRFESIKAAAAEGYLKESAIAARCRRELFFEFKPKYDRYKKMVLDRPWTYRWADEWDTMNEQQRIDDINDAKEGIRNGEKRSF